MDFLQQLLAAGQGMSAGQGAGGSVTGDVITELRKALTAGYGTDVTTFSGGSALRIQSLDHTMKATIQENEHFKLFNALQKANAGATVDEWTEMSGIGGFLGGSTNTETGNINSAQGQYQRRAAFVKYLMTRREVSFVATLGNNIVEAEAIEARNGALQLLTDAEFLCFEGDSSVVPTEFDGIDVQIASLGSSDHVIDAAGASLSQLAQVNQSVAVIVGMGNFGKPTDLFCSNKTQADFDNNMDAAARVTLNALGEKSGVEKGSPVIGIRTSWGVIKPQPDVFIRDEDQQLLFELLYPTIVATNGVQAPAAVAVSANTGISGSNWQTAHAGQFYYAVTSINQNGQSMSVMSSAVTVVAGGSVTITITRSAGGGETGYVIYRSRKNGTNALNDVRQMKRIPASGSATTVFQDTNQDFPGTTRARMLSMGAGSDAINWRQLLPMTKFPLYPTAAPTVPWAQLLFGYLRIAKRKQHTVIKNIVCTAQLWKPFG